MSARVYERLREACRRGGGLALAVALAVALGAGAVPAWADNETAEPADAPTNADVPTDEAGVVDPAAREEEGAKGEPGDSGESGQPTAPGAEGASGAEGDVSAPGGEDAPADESVVPEEGAATPPAPKRVAPDLVFGEGVREDNLLNPQQKPDSSFIYDTSIGALQEADSYLNNQTVQVTGEVVGDRIRAEFDPGFCWIVLQGNDKGRSEVPVFISLDATGAIDTYGAYGRRGTMLQIRGVFHLSCPQHQGLTDLHADTVSVVESGSVTEQVPSLRPFLPGIGLVLIGFTLLILFRHMREGQR